MPLSTPSWYLGLPVSAIPPPGISSVFPKNATIQCANSSTSLIISGHPIQSVEGCGLGIKVIRILPDDLVSVSDIAQRLHTDRQRVSMWVNGERRGKLTPFPPAILKLSHKSPMWRWYSVVKWLYQENLINDEKIIDYAKFLEGINAVLEERDPEIKKYRHQILNKLENFRGPKKQQMN